MIILRQTMGFRSKCDCRSRLCRWEGHPSLIVSGAHLWGSLIVCENLPPGTDCTAGPWGWKSPLPTLNTLHQVIVKSSLTSCVTRGASEIECAQGKAERGHRNAVLTSVTGRVAKGKELLCETLRARTMRSEDGHKQALALILSFLVT